MAQERLIRPNVASVFVASDTTNWCHAPQEARDALQARPGERGGAIPAERWATASRLFEDQVRALFASHGWHDVHAMLLPETHAQVALPRHFLDTS